jgi:hypothetical protein
MRDLLETVLRLSEADSNIEAMVDSVYNELYPNPLNSCEVGFANNEQTGAVFMELEAHDDAVYLKFIRAYPHKGGMGTQGLNYLKEKAREFNVPIKLTVWDKGEVSKAKLTAIYKKAGFVPGKGGYLWWYSDQ